MENRPTMAKDRLDCGGVCSIITDIVQKEVKRSLSFEIIILLVKFPSFKNLPSGLDTTPTDLPTPE